MFRQNFGSLWLDLDSELGAVVREELRQGGFSDYIQVWVQISGLFNALDYMNNKSFCEVQTPNSFQEAFNGAQAGPSTRTYWKNVIIICL